MTYLAIIIALGALIVSIAQGRRRKNTLLALQAAEQRKDELASTLADIVDADGEVRGQLKLPGTPPADEVMTRLVQGLTEMRECTAAMVKAKRELEKIRDREEKLNMTVLEIADKDGVVLNQIRVPSKSQPNRTPCGSLCLHAKESRDKTAYFCRAGGDVLCYDVRHQFLDNDGQCVMFRKRLT